MKMWFCHRRCGFLFMCRGNVTSLTENAIRKKRLLKRAVSHLYRIQQAFTSKSTAGFKVWLTSDRRDDQLMKDQEEVQSLLMTHRSSSLIGALELILNTTTDVKSQNTNIDNLSYRLLLSCILYFLQGECWKQSFIQGEVLWILIVLASSRKASHFHIAVSN